MIFITRNFYLFSPSPFFIPMLGLILGILYQSFAHTLYNLPLFFCTITTIFLVIIRIIKITPYNPPYTLIAFLAAFPTGSVLYQNQLNQFDRFYHETRDCHFDVIGTVNDISTNNHPTMQSTITLQMQNIKKTFSKKWQSIDKKILIYTAWHELQVGDIISLSNLSFKKSYNNSFNYYLIREKIVATLFIYRLQPMLEQRPNWSLRRFIFNQRERLFNTIKKRMPPKTFTFFSLLFLGNRTILKPKAQLLTEQFKKWGISHLLARSGIHLTIFVLTWQIMLWFIPLSFIIKQFILTALSIVYFLFSWPSVSFVRAFSLFILYQFCNLTKRPAHFLHLLSLTCFLFLILNPMHIFFLDFQLSFSITFALTWFNQLYQMK